RTASVDSRISFLYTRLNDKGGPMVETYLKFEHPQTAARTHVPDMESFAWNQKPKVGVLDARLYRYDGTDLYQWYARAVDAASWDRAGEPVVIRPRDAVDLEATNAAEALREAVAVARVCRDAVDVQMNTFLRGGKPNWKSA